MHSWRGYGISKRASEWREKYSAFNYRAIPVDTFQMPLVIPKGTQNKALRNASLRWRHGRMVWRTEGWESTRRKQNSWSQVLANRSRDSSAFPCSVCRSGVGANSISCYQCKLWIQKKCSGIMGRLDVNCDYVCPRCLDQALPLNGWHITTIEVDGTLLDVEPGGGCALAIATRCSTAWGSSGNYLQNWLPSMCHL